MQRVGDDTAGFSVDASPAGGVSARGWGFWSAEVAMAFASTVIEACRGREQGSKLLLDMRDLNFMNSSGILTLVRWITKAKTHGSEKGYILVLQYVLAYRWGWFPIGGLKGRSRSDQGVWAAIH